MSRPKKPKVFLVDVDWSAKTQLVVKASNSEQASDLARWFTEQGKDAPMAYRILGATVIEAPKVGSTHARERPASGKVIEAKFTRK